MAGPFKEEDKRKANLFLWGLIDFVCTHDLFVLVIILPSFSFSAQTPKKPERFPLQIPF